MEVEKILSVEQLMLQYDTAAKKLIGNKKILARIISQTIDEFKEMPLEEIEQCIDGEVLIDKVPVEPGLTNQSDEKQVIGFNTEDNEINEGTIRFDIIFYLRTGDGHARVIVNVEVQKDEPQKYDILNRSIYYIGRMISSQKGKDFIKTNYNDMKRCYSIWLCLNQKKNSINHIHLHEEKVLGNVSWKGNLDLIHIIMVGIANTKNLEKVIYHLEESAPEEKLLRMLGLMFAKQIPGKEKIEVLKKHYHIISDHNIGEEVDTMCNASAAIWEEAWEEAMEEGIEQGKKQGIEQGKKQGIEQGMQLKCVEIISNMYRNGFPVEQIAAIMSKSVDEVRKIISEEEQKIL